MTELERIVKAGGFAFPVKDFEIGSGGFLDGGGLTIRDWFAGQALSALLSTQTVQAQLEHEVRAAMTPESDRRRVVGEVLAKRSYWIADAMLAQREIVPANSAGATPTHDEPLKGAAGVPIDFLR